MSLLAYRLRASLVALSLLLGLSGTASLARADEQPEESTTAAAGEKSALGLGVHIRYIATPTWLLNLFLDHSTPMSSVSYGADFIRRKGKFDIDFGVEYANISPQNGLYLGKGDNPSMVGQYPDFVEFKNLSLITIDASFIWHVAMGDRVAFRYGAGIGIGFVLGDVKQTKTMCPSTTTASDLDDPNFCTQDPTQTKNASYPPVVPIPSLLVGLRIKVIDQLSFNLEAGFKLPSFFVGGGIGYFF